MAPMTTPEIHTDYIRLALLLADASDHHPAESIVRDVKELILAARRLAKSPTTSVAIMARIAAVVAPYGITPKQRAWTIILPIHSHDFEVPR